MMKRVLISFAFLFSLLCLTNTYSQELIRANTFGSSKSDFIKGYSADPKGNIVICGTFQYTIDPDPEEGEQFPMTARSKYDIYVAKYGVYGNFLWALQLGGSEWDYHDVYDIGQDKDGNIFICGFFNGWIDFDPSEEVDSINAGSETSIFIAKYNSEGEYLWAHSIGNDESIGNMTARGLAIDPIDQSVCMFGNINAPTDFDPSDGVTVISPVWYNDMYLVKYLNDGAFGWARLFPRSGDWGIGYPNRLQIDQEQNIYFGGTYEGSFDMDPSAEAYIIKSMEHPDYYSPPDGFLAKYSVNGEFQWCHSLGSVGYEYLWNFRLLDGKLYTVGSFADTVDFDPSESKYELISNGGLIDANGFLAVYNTDGSFHSAMAITTVHDEMYGSGLTVNDVDQDRFGNIYLIGSHYSTADFDPSEAEVLISPGNYSYDVFLASYDSDLNYRWAISVGGDMAAFGHFIHLTHRGEIVAMGYYNSLMDFDPAEGESFKHNTGGHDIFMAWYFAYSVVGDSEQKQTNRNELVIYPNPVSDLLTVESQNPIERIEVYSITGARVHVQSPEQGRIRMDLSNLVQGSYIMRIYLEAELQHRKFIKLD